MEKKNVIIIGVIGVLAVGGGIFWAINAKNKSDVANLQKQVPAADKDAISKALASAKTPAGKKKILKNLLDKVKNKGILKKAADVVGKTATS